MKIKVQNRMDYFIIVLFLLVFAVHVVAYTESGSTIESSTILDCAVEPTHLIDATINQSTVDCANITNSTLFYSNIRDAAINITDATLNFASVIDNILTSGQIIYGGYSYYGPFSLIDIFSGVPPSDAGTLETSAEAINGSATFYVTYSIGKLGFVVTIDATAVGAGAAISLVDTGVGNDAIANDGIYTSVDIVANTGALGDQDLIAAIDDGLGNGWSLTETIYVDNTDPTGTFYISDADENRDSEETSSRIVTLHMSASDNYNLDGCRFANNGTDITTKPFETCLSTGPHILEALNGEKKVNFQIRDSAGNIKTYTDAINLNSPVLPGPTVDDDTDYWGYSDRINFELTYASGTQTQGVTYRYRIYNGSSKDDSSNITDWRYAEIADVWDYDVTLQQGLTYYVGVKAYSGGISSETFSDGFVLDLTNPTFDSLTADVANATWVSSSVIAVTTNASDAESGIEGFTYKLGTSDVDPDDILDVTGGDKIVYLTGLSEGIYYFNAKAKSNAKSFSEIKKYEFYVDATPPGIPTTSTPNATGSGTLRFLWNSVSDVSNVTEYNVVISSDSNFGTIVGNYSTNNTYYDYSASSTATYYFKVRAKNGAGLYGLFSDQFDFLVDSTPPGFVSKTPNNGLIVTTKPIFHIETNEIATCSYKKDSDLSYSTFEFTGAKGHDQKLSLTDGSSYTYVVLCTDISGNANSTSVSFSVDTSKSVSAITPAVSTLTGFRSMVSEFLISVTSGGTGVSGLNPADFSLKLGSKYLTDFSITDTGDGNYLVSFTTPKQTGTQSLIVEYDSISSSAVSFSVSDLIFEVSVNLGGGSTAPITELSHLTYAEETNYAIGLATTADDVFFNNSVVNKKLEIKNRIGSESLIFFVSANKTSFKNKNKLLDSKKFEEESNPNFGSGSRKNLVVDIILNYQNIVFNGIDASSRGDHNIRIRNDGLTADKKINISVSVT